MYEARRARLRRSAAKHSRRLQVLVVPRDTEVRERPQDEHDAPVDRLARHRAEDAAVLRRAAIVAEHVVLAFLQVNRRKWIRRDVVDIFSVHVHVAAETNDRVTRNTDYALRDPELVRVRIWNDRPADLAARVEENDLTSMRIAETVREVLIEVTPVTSRQRRRHAERSLRIAGKDQAGQAEHPHDHDDRQQNSERNQDALATQTPA